MRESKTTRHGRQRVCRGLDIEIIHRRSLNNEAEQISINLQAMPSFEAFGRYLETANPFVLWAQAVKMAWLPLTPRVL
jgi:hypothetical protein